MRVGPLGFVEVVSVDGGGEVVVVVVGFVSSSLILRPLSTFWSGFQVVELRWLLIQQLFQPAGPLRRYAKPWQYLWTEHASAHVFGLETRPASMS